MLWGLPVLLVGSCLFRGTGNPDYAVQPVADGCDPAVQSCLQPSPSGPVLKADASSWVWEDQGSGYCKASGRIRNTGTKAIEGLRVIIEFDKGGKPAGSEWSFADVKYLPPGESTTWDNFFRCPVRGATATVSMTARGEIVYDSK